MPVARPPLPHHPGINSDASLRGDLRRVTRLPAYGVYGCYRYVPVLQELFVRAHPLCLVAHHKVCLSACWPATAPVTAAAGKETDPARARTRFADDFAAVPYGVFTNALMTRFVIAVVFSFGFSTQKAR